MAVAFFSYTSPGFSLELLDLLVEIRVAFALLPAERSIIAY